MAIDVVPFTDLLSKIVDNRGRTCPTAEIGLPLIATNCIRNDLLYPAFEKVRYVSEHTYENWFRGHPEPGDLIFVCKGTPGRVCITPDPVTFCIAQDMVAVRPDPTKVHPWYLFALLRSELVQRQIENMHVGTLIPHFKKGDFDKLLLPVPDRNIQESIGDTYFELSAKIELNRRMNATLEALARALFQSWFVDFDPVRAKMAGHTPLGMDAETAKLFPAGFVDSELGKIPEGWRVMKVGEFIERLSVGQKYEQKTVSPVGKVPVLDQGKSGVIGYHNEEPGVTATADKPVVVFANHTCYMRLVTYPFSAIQNVLPFVGSGVDTYWAYYATQDRLAFSEYKGHWPDFVIQELVVPPCKTTDAFGRFAKLIVARIRANEVESRTLTTLRDTLLPKLLSGELWVGDAERIVGRAM